MNKQFSYPTVVLLIAALFSMGGSNIVVAQEIGFAVAEEIPGQYIVVLKESDIAVFDVVAEFAAEFEFNVERDVDHFFEFALRGFVARIPEVFVDRLAMDPRIDFVEPDLVASTLGNLTPTGVDRVNADSSKIAMFNDIDGPPPSLERVDADIAIIDTGIDLDHPNLYVFANRSFIRGASDGDDDNGHGTHVAGTAAALDNYAGVVGVAPEARLWALKVLDNNGKGSFSNIIAAIDFVTANAAEIEVVNMSLGGNRWSQATWLAIQNSVARGVVYVVAAGNSKRDIYGPDGTWGTQDDTVPAAFPEVAAISAMADSDGKGGGPWPKYQLGG